MSVIYYCSFKGPFHNQIKQFAYQLCFGALKFAQQLLLVSFSVVCTECLSQTTTFTTDRVWSVNIEEVSIIVIHSTKLTVFKSLLCVITAGEVLYAKSFLSQVT